MVHLRSKASFFAVGIFLGASFTKTITPAEQIRSRTTGKEVSQNAGVHLMVGHKLDKKERRSSDNPNVQEPPSNSVVDF